MSFESQLSNFLSDCEKLIVLGVGNELKSDDGVGPFIINKLKEENIEDNKRLLFINAKTVPENFTGKIRKENPSHIIIIDACLMGLNPGEYKIVDREEFSSIGISTHSMSLSYFVKFLNQDNIIFLGIEPQSLELIDQDSLGVVGADLMEFNGQLNENVEKGALKIIEILKEILWKFYL